MYLHPSAKEPSNKMHKHGSVDANSSFATYIFLSNEPFTKSLWIYL